MYSFCLISLLGLWKEAAHTSLGYSPMMRTWLPSMTGQGRSCKFHFLTWLSSWKQRQAQKWLRDCVQTGQSRTSQQGEGTAECQPHWSRMGYSEDTMRNQREPTSRCQRNGESVRENHRLCHNRPASRLLLIQISSVSVTGKWGRGGGGSILEPGADSLLPSDVDHMLHDIMEATHSPPRTEVFTDGSGG